MLFGSDMLSDSKPNNVKLIPKPSFLSDKIAGREINVKKNAITNDLEKFPGVIIIRINQAKKTNIELCKPFLREFFLLLLLTATTTPTPTTANTISPTAAATPTPTTATTTPTNIVIRFLIILLSCK